MGNCFGRHSPEAVITPPVGRRDEGQIYVTNDVVKLRAQADDFHTKVVECAQQASEAYQRGDKKRAHELSQQKTDYQREQDAANRIACRLILEAQRWERTGTIDLHGLYLQEAMEAVQTFLSHHAQLKASTVLIITGAGHHSKGKQAVIRPKVEELLKQRKLDYKSVHGDGAFEIHLRPRQ